MPYLFDGYNLLRAIQKMEEFASFTDVQLCRALSDYLCCIRDHGRIIFDGIGPSDKSALAGMRSLEVYFSGENREADSIIEDKIQDNTAPKSLFVVSSDRRLRTAAVKRKATALTAENFWQILLNRMEKQANRPAPEPSQKRHGLTDRETDLWLDVFDLDR
ncbi:MAG: NYN domain-containing protein [Planctomycetales bacterium]|nr:NYN domain-containing protein [Planctomycetales bacterium]